MRIIRSPASYRRDQRDLVTRVDDLISGGKLSVDRYSWRLWKDGGAWKQSQAIDEIGDGAA
jgi:hypothetical protein